MTQFKRALSLFKRALYIVLRALYIVLCLLLALLVDFLLSSCSTTAPRHDIITVPATQVHIVEDPSQLPCGRAGCARLGYSESGQLEVWVVGGWQEHGIVLSDMVLGHEMRHILRHLDRDVADPHGDVSYQMGAGWLKWRGTATDPQGVGDVE